MGFIYSRDDCNVVWCERSIGVINTYATVIRRLAAEVLESDEEKERLGPLIREAESVLGIGGLQLRRYKSMVETQAEVSAVAGADPGTGGPKDPIEVLISKRCLKGLTYKYLLIKHNLLCMTGRVGSQNPKELRFMAEWELEEYGDEACKVAGDDDRLQVASLLMVLLNRPLTRSAVDSTTDKEMRQVFKIELPRMMQRIEPDKYNKIYVSCVRFCGECGVFEGEDEKFSRCARCGVEFYCSKYCQVHAWKSHKLVCSSKS